MYFFQLRTYIYTNTEINNGCYNFSYGQDADTVYSIALCRPDIRPDDCRSCIRNACDSLVRNCPNFVEAIGGLDNCMVRYTNRSIFNRMEQGPYFWVYDVRFNVSDVVGFNQSLMTLLGRLSDQAAEGDSRYKYAMDQIADDRNFRIIYALVQCVRINSIGKVKQSNHRHHQLRPPTKASDNHYPRPPPMTTAPPASVCNFATLKSKISSFHFVYK